jgi:hypothetical protein
MVGDPYFGHYAQSASKPNSLGLLVVFQSREMFLHVICRDHLGAGFLAILLMIEVEQGVLDWVGID